MSRSQGTVSVRPSESSLNLPGFSPNALSRPRAGEACVRNGDPRYLLGVWEHLLGQSRGTGIVTEVWMTRIENGPALGLGSQGGTCRSG